MNVLKVCSLVRIEGKKQKIETQTKDKEIKDKERDKNRKRKVTKDQLRKTDLWMK